MKRVFAVMALFFVAATYAAVPETIDYQAYLTDATGAAQTGTVTVAVSLYGQAVGGDALWSDTLAVDADNGLIGIALGREGNPFPAGLFDGTTWVGIAVSPDAEMIPRRQLTSVAYSLKSDDADSVQGLQASEIINAAAGAQYRFVGFTSASVASGAGYLALHQACQADFGADARMANTAEVLNKPIAGGAGGWVRPTQIVIDSGNVTDVPSMAQAFSVNGNAGRMNCNQWSTNSFSSSGLYVYSSYLIQPVECGARPVACSAP